MLKTFRITGYAVNKRGLTVGFNQTISATSQKQAQQQAIAECEEFKIYQRDGFPFAEVNNGEH